MLQANNNSNNDANDTQADILKRLEKLNKWQEEQKQLLHERQNMQRQMLGMEQRSMYEMLGLELLQPDDSPMSQEKTSNDMMVGDGDHLQFDRYELKESRISKTDSELQGVLVNEDDLRVVEGELQLVKTPQKPKRTFLKRGEGLKQRFRISPEALRLNNLPHYKYATTHPKVRNQRRKKVMPTRTSAAANDFDSSPQMFVLDAHEKQFQQLLISSKNVCNSTPDMKNSTSTVSSVSVTMPKVRFAGMAEKRRKDNEKEDSSSQTLDEANNNSAPKISWSTVLDSQQIKPISVLMMRSKHSDCDKIAHSENINDDSNLSIFELLEDKANDGTVDMNSSCIKAFMERKLREKLNEVDIIHVDRRIKQAGIKPEVKELVNAHDLCSDEDDNDKCGNTNNSEKNGAKTQVRVHFSDKHDTREYNYESASDCSALAEEISNISSNSSDLFHKFKNALYSALLNKAENGVEQQQYSSVLDETDLSTALALQQLPSHSAAPIATSIQSPSVSPLTQELQTKSILIKTRLEELENEITTFKESNLKLLKAKQQHEMEKASFTEERLELMSRLNDSKIQMEIYLHDERMKIENEKRSFEKQMRKLKTSVTSKERKEIARLKQELEQMQAQLKQKEQVHASAQARLRVQVRNLERDQKQLYEDIERLTKENKKLENENLKIGRENNQKMLYEINRNIAKLAPKLGNPEENSYHKNTKPKASPSETSTRKLLSKTFSKQLTSQKSVVKTTAPPPPSLSNSETAVIMPLPQLKSNQKIILHDGDDVDVDDDDDLTQELQYSPNPKKELTQNGTQTDTNVAETTTTTNEFKREIINADGSKDIWYPNGNLKKISADGMIIRMLYFNQDIKETNVNEGTVKYYYSETNTWHTTYLDGLEILEFPNGQTEHRYKNGIVEIHFPDNSIKVTNPADENKLEEWRLADGTNLTQMRNGDKILMLPNGQKEIHTKLNKRREYPDGTVKLVYPDGSQETRYSNGRVRLKDKNGILVMDTEGATG